MFLYAAAAAVVNWRAHGGHRSSKVAWGICFLLFILVVGLRHEVGGDWHNYEENYFRDLGMPLDEALSGKDPGFQFLTWISMQVGGGVYLVNFFASIFFAAGLVVFCRSQPRPWLALTVAVPYLVIVVAMGYTRQGAAIGLAMMGIVALSRHKNWLFVVLVILAATLHKSAVILVPIAILATPKRKVWTAVWAGITAVVVYVVLLADSVDDLVLNYIDAEYSSEGAGVRVAMNIVPAVLLLVLRKRLSLPPAERNLWLLLSVFAIGCGIWLPLSSSSTAVDRLALYLIPLQMFVFARLPELLNPRPGGGIASIWVYAVVLYYATVQFVWLNFAVHSKYWVPYGSLLFI